jgi:hypothetical protein
MARSFDLGTFEGFNFRSQSAIVGNLTAEEVIDWDHDEAGEAEFWPSGDRPEVALIFRGKSAVTGAELKDLSRVLEELGDDSRENLLLIHQAININGYSLESLSASSIEDTFTQIFCGTSFIDVRREAAYELFELYYPEEYKVWEKSLCDGLIFDTDHFLDSPCFSVEEIKLGDEVFLLVTPQ